MSVLNTIQGGSMSIAPRGMSIQEAYRSYRDDNFLVNRRYQRKLVWTTQEKARLIDSILKGYPIPLILLAAHSKAGEISRYEIIDGIQRFNAIFSFIENDFFWKMANILMYWNLLALSRQQKEDCLKQ